MRASNSTPRSARWSLLLLATVVGAVACGSFIPPVQFSAGADPDRTASAPPDLSLQPVEGRPDGLVLELNVGFEPESGSRLVVERRRRDASKVLKSIELDGDLARRIPETGIEFIDRSVRPGPPHHYRLSYYAPGRTPGDGGDPDRISAVRTLEWREPPPRPEEVTARADFSRAVELRWQTEGNGALVFRRNVLEGSAGPKRLASFDSGRRGVLLDRDVRPGAVYAYRVALAAEYDEITQYGPPSESLYVSVPDS